MSQAATSNEILEAGQFAPDFTMPTDNGGQLTLSELRGKKVVLYFYPKDDTPGCTTEAKDFTEHKAEFEAANTEIIGVSKDDIDKHCKFRDKHGLAVTLAYDETGTVCEAYNTWVEKNMYGKKYMGIQRDTFLIDEEGKIRKVWRKVKVNGHVEEVLEAAKALN